MPSPTKAEAASLEQWAPNVFGSSVLANLPTPTEFEHLSRFVRPDDLHGPVRISSDLEHHVEWLRPDVDLGFSRIDFHNVHAD